MEMIQIEIGHKRYDVLHAITEEEKERGLQNIEELGEREGCLFDYSDDPQDELSFWMKDTEIPLDIIFIDEDGDVISVRKGEPNSEELITESNGPIGYVLELNVNSGVKIGDDLELDDEEDENESQEMQVISPDGNIMTTLEGGERIFSRVNTRVLIRKAKRAYKSKEDKDYKALGKYMFKCIKQQDTREPEYVEQ